MLHRGDSVSAFLEVSPIQICTFALNHFKVSNKDDINLKCYLYAVICATHGVSQVTMGGTVAGFCISRQPQLSFAVSAFLNSTRSSYCPWNYGKSFNVAILFNGTKTWSMLFDHLNNQLKRKVLDFNICCYFIEISDFHSPQLPLWQDHPRTMFTFINLNL